MPIVASQEDDAFITYFSHNIIIASRSSADKEYIINETPCNDEIKCICLGKTKSAIYYVDSGNKLATALVQGNVLSDTKFLLSLPSTPISIKAIKADQSEVLIICCSNGIIYIFPPSIFEENDCGDTVDEIKDIILQANYENSESYKSENINHTKENDWICLSHRFIKQFHVLYGNNLTLHMVSYGENTMLLSICSMAIWELNLIDMQITKLIIENTMAPILNAKYINKNLICAYAANNAIIIYDVCKAKELFTVNSIIHRPIFIKCRIMNIDQNPKNIASNYIKSGVFFEFVFISANGEFEYFSITDFRINWDTIKEGQVPSYIYTPISLYKGNGSIHTAFMFNGQLVIYQDNGIAFYVQRGWTKEKVEKDADISTSYTNHTDIGAIKQNNMLQYSDTLNRKHMNPNILQSKFLTLRSGDQAIKPSYPLQKNVNPLPIKKKHTLTLKQINKITRKDTLIVGASKEVIQNHKTRIMHPIDERKNVLVEDSIVVNPISVVITDEINRELEDKTKYKIGKYNYDIHEQSINLEEYGIQIKANGKMKYQNSYSNLQTKIAKQIKSKQSSDGYLSQLAFDSNESENTAINLDPNSNILTVKAIENKSKYAKGCSFPQLDSARRKEIVNKYNQISKNQRKLKPKRKLHKVDIIYETNQEAVLPSRYLPILNKRKSVSPKKVSKPNEISLLEKETRHSSVSNHSKYHINLPTLHSSKSELGKLQKTLNNLARSLEKSNYLDQPMIQDSSLLNALTIIKNGGLNPEGVSNVLQALSAQRAGVSANSSINEDFANKFDITKLLSDIQPSKINH